MFLANTGVFFFQLWIYWFYKSLFSVLSKENLSSIGRVSKYIIAVISSIFDKCLILQQRQSRPNHTSNIKVYFNEFVANALRDTIGSKNQPLASEKHMRPFFSFLIGSDCMVYLDPKLLILFNYQNFRVMVNHAVRHNQHNQTQFGTK